MITEQARTCADRVSEHWASRLDDLRRFMSAEDDETREEFWDYALSFDYVEPGTFVDQDEPYFRYLISWGGPSDEIRFYAGRGRRGWTVHRAEYWFLDWFDGAPLDVTHEPAVRWLFEDLDCGEAVDRVFQVAVEG